MRTNAMQGGKSDFMIFILEHFMLVAFYMMDGVAVNVGVRFRRYDTPRKRTNQP